MSTVRMSDYLRRDVVRAFEESHKKSKSPIESDPVRGDAIYNRYIGPKVEAAKTAMQEHLGDIMDPTNMFGVANQLRCVVPIHESRSTWADDNEDKTITTELNETHTLYIPLSTERVVPVSIQKSSYGGTAYAEDMLYKFDRYDDADLNYLCECFEYNQKLEAQRDVASHKVNNLLCKFTTLNQALKAWPALSKLVEPEKLAKVHEKQQRKRKQEQQKQMADEVVLDNELNKTILTASLLGDD